MKHVVRVSGDTYRTDLAAVRKNFALSRAGSDICVRLECTVPHTPRQDWIEVFISRHSLWLIGMRNQYGGFKFADGNPLIDDVAFTRSLPFSLHYTILDAWDENTAYRGIWDFHGAIQTLGDITDDTYFGPREKRYVALMIFMIPEALRFWPIDKAISEAICNSGHFRLTDWKAKVTAWRQSSEGAHGGFSDGVTMPWLKKI